MTAPSKTLRSERLVKRPQPPSLIRRDSCAKCPTISPCIGCSAGKSCQQVFMPSGDCNTCPTNICVSDGENGNSSGPSAGAIAGPVAATLGTIIIAATLVYIWWRRRRSKTIARAQARAEAKARDAKTKAFTLGANAARPSPQTAQSEIDNDTEWTQMDTGGLHSFGRTDPRMYRESVGAATHLSRITEGAELDDEGEDDLVVIPGPDRAQTAYASAATAAPRSAGRDSSILLRRSRSSHDPFSDPLGTERLGRFPIQPAQAHRPLGAPLIAVETNTLKRTPSRPERHSELNLRLPDVDRTQSSGKEQWQSARTILLAKPEAQKGVSPAAPSTAESQQFPKSALLQAPGHDPSSDASSRRSFSSITTTNSGLSDLSYIFSSPQIMTVNPPSGGPRPSLDRTSPTPHKAQLVRNLSDLRRRPSQKTQRVHTRGDSGDPFGDHNAPRPDSAPNSKLSPGVVVSPDSQEVIAFASDAGKSSGKLDSSRSGPSSLLPSVLGFRSSTASSDDGLTFRIPILDLTKSANSEPQSASLSSAYPGPATGRDRSGTSLLPHSAPSDTPAGGAMPCVRKQLSPRDVRQDEDEESLLEDEDQPDRPPSNWLGSPRNARDSKASDSRQITKLPNHRFTTSTIGGLSVLDGFDWSMPSDSASSTGSPAASQAVPPLPPWLQRRGS